jgi:hypothetical protein
MEDIQRLSNKLAERENCQKANASDLTNLWVFYNSAALIAYIYMCVCVCIYLKLG